MTRSEIAEAARRIGEELLFPSALATDAAEIVPVENLDALAEAGLYGLAGPVEAGGLDADFPTVCEVIEGLASACLTTLGPAPRRESRQTHSLEGGPD